MEGKIRNLYPGGNTPDGFYSYYNYILPQRKAEKIFCLKGGPGTGKSTLMRKVGQHFIDKGEDVDFLWCSSDPGSLDGILVKKRNAAILDGTSPHIVDPKNPGAVDEIINLGEFWNEELIRKNRSRVISCNEKTAKLFGYVYGYLKCAQQQYEFLSHVLDESISYEKMREYKSQVCLKLDGISVLRRSESKIKRDSVLGKDIYTGEKRKFFAGAITPGGIKNNIISIIDNIERIIIIDVPIGFRSEKLLSQVSERFTDAGFDIEEYYCPMFPEDKLEHVVCPDAYTAVVCSNEYHVIDTENVSGKVIRIKVEDDLDSAESELLKKIYEDIKESSRDCILKAIEILKEAKANHDILEDYYVPNMDFDAMDDLREYIIEKIEEK